MGSHLLNRLVSRGHDVTILKRSLSNMWRLNDVSQQIKSYDLDKVEVERILDDNEVEGIIHLATSYGRTNGYSYSVVKMYKANVELPLRLLASGCSHGLKVFVNTHTYVSSEYSLQSAMKNRFIEVAKFFVRNYHLKFINMILGYVYGEKDDYSKFVPSLIKRILEGEEIKATKGNQRRDFVYVKDVANAYIALLDNLANLGDDYIELQIASGQSMSLKNFVKKVEMLTGKKAKIEWGSVPYRANEVFEWKANIQIALRLIGWRPETTLEEGLLRTIKWYQEEKSTISH